MSREGFGGEHVSTHVFVNVMGIHLANVVESSVRSNPGELYNSVFRGVNSSWTFHRVQP
jgi:hypothetical protein